MEVVAVVAVVAEVGSWVVDGLILVYVALYCRLALIPRLHLALGEDWILAVQKQNDQRRTLVKPY